LIGLPVFIVSKQTTWMIASNPQAWLFRHRFAESVKNRSIEDGPLIKAGPTTKIPYANHLEAVDCVAGEGEVKDLENGRRTQNRKWHDVCSLWKRAAFCDREKRYANDFVFNPPLVGPETHDENGVNSLFAN